MSLSFVSSAVLSSSDGVSHNEEKSIESKEVQALRGRQQHKPLFEQLRSNREEEEAQREDFQRSIMRGTRTLDEEDCAHLDAVQKQRVERDRVIKERTEEELALFRAARADRAQSELVVEEEHEAKEDADNEKSTTKSPSVENEVEKKSFIPVIVKRKRRKLNDEEPDSAKKSKTTITKQPSLSSMVRETNDGKKQGEAGLQNLLGGYGSSDDDSD